MAAHKFEEGITQNGLITAVKCSRCGLIMPFVNGKIPDEIQAQECLREGATILSMDERDDVHRRLRISNLRAKHELIEVERTALLREATSSLTSQDRRGEVMRRRAELAAQRDKVLDELKDLDSAC